MLRTSLSKLTLTAALLAATVAWSGFMALHTAFDPDRSERIADALLDDPYLQDKLASSLAASGRSLIPGGVTVSDEDLDAASDVAVRDKRLEAALHGSVVASHQRMLGDKDAVVSFDVAVVGAVSRDALISQRPDLADQLGGVPTLTVTPPAASLPQLGAVRRGLIVIVPFMTTVAVGLLGFALLVASRRPAVTTRVGRWAATTGAAWALIAVAGPPLVAALLGRVGGTVAAVLGALTASIVVASTLLTGCGVALLVAGRAWKRSQDMKAEWQARFDGYDVEPESSDERPAVRGPMHPKPHRADGLPDPKSF